MGGHGIPACNALRSNAGREHGPLSFVGELGIGSFDLLRTIAYDLVLITKGLCESALVGGYGIEP